MLGLNDRFRAWAAIGLVATIVGVSVWSAVTANTRRSDVQESLDAALALLDDLSAQQDDLIDELKKAQKGRDRLARKLKMVQRQLRRLARIALREGIVLPTSIVVPFSNGGGNGNGGGGNGRRKPPPPPPPPCPLPIEPCPRLGG